MTGTYCEIDDSTQDDGRTNDAVHVLQRRVRQRIIDDKQLSTIITHKLQSRSCLIRWVQGDEIVAVEYWWTSEMVGVHCTACES